jgi:hypothetical protein
VWFVLRQKVRNCNLPKQHVPWPVLWYEILLRDKRKKIRTLHLQQVFVKLKNSKVNNNADIIMLPDTVIVLGK